MDEQDPDCVWKDYCDFSKLDNSDWENLLTFNPEYANLRLTQKHEHQ